MLNVSKTIRFLFYLAIAGLLNGCIQYYTPLGQAAYNGDHEEVRSFLSNGTDVNEQQSYYKDTALHEAARAGHADIVRFLIEKGADVNIKNIDGWRPLHFAIAGGDAEIVRILLDSGASTGGTVIMYHGGPRITALQFAEEKGYTNIAQMIREAENRYVTPKQPIYPDTQKADIQVPDLPVAAGPADASDAQIDFGSYHALIIGNNDYQSLPGLRTPVNDAKAMAVLLEEKYGFKTKMLLNATRKEILKALYSYRQTLTGKDNLLIYYAGHGWLDKDADEGYWLPVDAENQDPANWISNSSITSSLRAMQAKHVLIIADSCYSGKLARGINIKMRGSDYYRRMAMKKARTVMASGGLEPVEDEGGQGNHSVFASTLIDTLNANQEILDATALFSKIRRPVILNADQTPEYSDIRKAGHDGGDFLFVRKKR